MFSAATKCPAILRACMMLAKVGLIVLTMFLSLGRGIVVADSSAETCASGIAVTNPQDNPLLVQDCEALLEARDILSQGGRRLIWTADTPMSKWDGISIGGSPARVTELRIRGDFGGSGSLEGSIPSELGQLTGLVTLVLHANALRGTIPTELGRLTQLVTLRLEGNELTGEIPASLGRLANLYDLDLYGNELTGEMPAELGQLERLTYLRLGYNRLAGEIPPELGGLPWLRRLEVDHNQLSGAIPPELGGLPNLQFMNFDSNKLTGTIPHELGDLSNLKSLVLSRNQLTGEIPVTLTELANLQHLALNENKLAGNVPKGLSDLIRLKWIELQENKLTGSIPEELGNLVALQSMLLFDNRLSGRIPPTLGKLSNLRELSLGSNELTGEIPQSFGDLSELGHLSLGNNMLTGEIPATLGDLTELRALYLSNNELTGEIPGTLGDLTRLEFIQLQNNQLTGEIPVELGDLVELRLLNLEDNRLSGIIPPELGRLANLWGLSLGANQLTGEIPATIGGLINLTFFGASSNLLSGCVPLELSRFESYAFEDTDLRFCFAVDDNPAIVDSEAQLTVAEGNGIRIDESVLLANDMETENYTLRITDVGGAVNGTVSLAVSTIVFSHDGSETTSGSFTYTASDGVHSSMAKATITVNPVNDPPIAVGDTATVDEGDTLSMEASVLLDNDTDAENDTLGITSVGDGVNGTVLLDGMRVTYEHDGSETTSGSFAYTVSDGTDTSTATVTITVNPVNDPPVAVGDTATVDQGDTLSMEASVLLDNDTDAENDTLGITSVGDGVNGTVLLDGMTVTYEHDGSETTTQAASPTRPAMGQTPPPPR